MPTLSYQQAGLVLKRPGTGASDAQIRDLQRHLRALGYLRQGIDGDFRPGTEGAVKGVQHDLPRNDGSDGQAPMSDKKLAPGNQPVSKTRRLPAGWIKQLDQIIGRSEDDANKPGRIGIHHKA